MFARQVWSDVHWLEPLTNKISICREATKYSSIIGISTWTSPEYFVPIGEWYVTVLPLVPRVCTLLPTSLLIPHPVEPSDGLCQWCFQSVPTCCRCHRAQYSVYIQAGVSHLTGKVDLLSRWVYKPCWGYAVCV